LPVKQPPPIELWHWLAFGGLVLVLLAIDLVIARRRDRAMSLGESAVHVACWCLLAAIFNLFIWWWRSERAALQFLTGYLLEWSLSMDNVFVFAVVFRYFQVPRQHQYRVLYWGILGAIVMRLVFILAGAALIARFQFVLPLFGLVLLYSAFRLAVQTTEGIDPEQNVVLRLARRWLPMAQRGQAGYGEWFFLREDGRLVIAPIFLVLLVIESTDVVFAVDSVPAIFGITRDPFIIFTSNIFAILGLRALYFLLAGAMELFRYLHFGLAAILAFVGLKMIAEWAFPQGAELVPTWLSLVVIAILLGGAVTASLVAESRARQDGDCPNFRGEDNARNETDRHRRENGTVPFGGDEE
jgi:tellurite resistance protein TerC